MFKEPSQQLIIGLSGKAGSGKDTVAEQWKSIVHRIAFADSLKEECAVALGITVDQLNEGKTLYRGLLQWWGTEYRRSENLNYWIDRASEKVDDIFGRSLSSIIVITDVRFQNEFDWLKSRGGILVRVHRPVSRVDGSQAAHASEVDLDRVIPDYAVNNYGSLEEFQKNAASLLHRIIEDQELSPTLKAAA